MDQASTEKVVLGSIAFVVFWVSTVFPEVPFIPVGRTAGSLLGAVLMVIFRVLTPEEAYSAIDLSILGLLFGTMVVSVYLETADLFTHLGKLLSWKSFGPKDLLIRICLVSAISSALFTNDTSCLVLTEFVLKIARQNNIPPQPFLLALASSANIGSSATPIGNPQNLVIAIHSKIPFGQFFLGIVPAMLLGVFVNVLFLLGMYWRVLRADMDEENANLGEAETVINIQMGLKEAHNDDTHMDVKVGDASEEGTEDHTNLEHVGWRRLTWKTCVYLVTVGMMVALLIGFNMSWTALTAALVLVVLNFKDAGPCLDMVSYSILVFFCGMFVTVEGFNRTGIPNTLWNVAEPHARIDRASGIILLACVILLLSNVASNVPTVILLGARVAASTTSSCEEKAWLILAWVSTVAGNLSLLGSAANLIVCEQARRSKDLGYNLTFWDHLKFGVPSTIVVTAIGLVVIRACGESLICWSCL